MTTLLAIFDIDGTLLRTNRVDGACYAQALEEFGISGFSTDWTTYRYSTDLGILTEIFERHRGRLPAADELQAIRRRFLRLLTERWTAEPSAFRPVRATVEAFRAFQQDDRCAVAIATGCWRESARMKLSTIGLDLDSVDAHCADDHVERAQLLHLALASAGAGCGGAPLRAVYIGDRAWDLRAARTAGIGFVGVDADGTGAELRAAGADCLLPQDIAGPAAMAFIDGAALTPGGRDSSTYLSS